MRLTVPGFNEGKPYAMDKENGKPFITTQYVRASHGKAERDWPFIYCSDSGFTDAEWNRYRQTCLAEGVKIPNRAAFQAKEQDMYNLENRSWTDAELTEKLRRSGALDVKSKTVERNKLTKQLNQAKLFGHTERADQLRAELAALDPPKLAYGTSLFKPEPATPLSQQQRLARINEEARRKAVDEAKAAQLAEMRQSAAESRRAARPRAVLKSGAGAGSGASTPARETPKATPKLGPEQQDSEPLPHMAKLQAELEKQKQQGGLPTIRRPLCDDDIIGAIDLGIEIEL